MKRRILGLDIGSRSCGIAISDLLQITAQGKENFRFEEKDWTTLLNHLGKYIEEYDFQCIVIGYPTLPSGDKSKTTLMVEEVEKLIANKFNLKVIRVDEEKTTKRAHEVMILANTSRKKRKENKDKLAAQLILMDYLNSI